MEKKSLIVHELDGTAVLVRKECKNLTIQSNMSAEDVYNCMNKIFKFEKLTKEYSYIIALDKEKCPISILKSSPGESKSVCVNYIDIAYYMKYIGAEYIIAAHNHPSGDPTPSLKDVERFVELYKIFGEVLDDFIVFGSEDATIATKYEEYYSFKEREYFKCPDSNIYIHHLDRISSLLTYGLELLDSNIGNHYGRLKDHDEQIEKIKASLDKHGITIE